VPLLYRCAGLAEYNRIVLERSGDEPMIEAVIDEHGNAIISAEQLPRGLAPGTHLRVHVEEPVGRARRRIEGLLPNLPDLSWEDFEAGSRLAIDEAKAADLSR
jgi:hypothetical protein